MQVRRRARILYSLQGTFGRELQTDGKGFRVWIFLFFCLAVSSVLLLGGFNGIGGVDSSFRILFIGANTIGLVNLRLWIGASRMAVKRVYW